MYPFAFVGPRIKSGALLLPERILGVRLESRFCSLEFVMRRSNWTPSIVPDLPSGIEDFVERHAGHADRQLALRLV
jgi:hypothetical protein